MKRKRTFGKFGMGLIIAAVVVSIPLLALIVSRLVTKGIPLYGRSTTHQLCAICAREIRVQRIFLLGAFVKNHTNVLVNPIEEVLAPHVLNCGHKWGTLEHTGHGLQATLRFGSAHLVLTEAKDVLQSSVTADAFRSITKTNWVRAREIWTQLCAGNFLTDTQAQARARGFIKSNDSGGLALYFEISAIRKP